MGQAVFLVVFHDHNMSHFDAMHWMTPARGARDKYEVCFCVDCIAGWKAFQVLFGPKIGPGRKANDTYEIATVPSVYLYLHAANRCPQAQIHLEKHSPCQRQAAVKTMKNHYNQPGTKKTNQEPRKTMNTNQEPQKNNLPTAASRIH